MKKWGCLLGHPTTIGFFMLITLGLLLEIIVTDISTILDWGLGSGQAALLEFEETIAVWLVGIGVLLEEREILSAKIYGAAIPERQKRLDHTCLHHGCGLLMVGLGIELIDQAFHLLQRYGLQPPAPYFLTLPLNLVAVYICSSLIINSAIRGDASRGSESLS